jgi:hypothetical protein
VRCVAAQDRVIAGLLRRLWRTPPFSETFRPLQQMWDQWAQECERKLAERPIPADPGHLREGIALFRSLPSSAERHVLLCTDLHADNVLATGREPWLTVDPKPYVGDPTYDALQHLLSCEDRLIENPLGLVERLAGLLDLDPHRLALWQFARCVAESPTGRTSSPSPDEWHRADFATADPLGEVPGYRRSPSRSPTTSSCSSMDGTYTDNETARSKRRSHIGVVGSNRCAGRPIYSDDGRSESSARCAVAAPMRNEHPVTTTFLPP